MTALLDATDAQVAMLADLVASLEAAEATLSSMQAARDGLLALAARLAIDIARQATHPDHGDLALRTVAAEIGAAQRVSDRTVERRMADASWLVKEFPGVWEAQGAGRISAAHARTIVDAGAHLSDAADRERFAADVLPVAETESPNRLRRLARRTAERYQKRTVAERHRDAREQRRVWLKDHDDGMAELGILGPAVLVHGMFDRLSQGAFALRDAQGRRKAGTDRGSRAWEPESSCTPEYDERTLDQLRADLLADLVLTGAPTGHGTVGALLSEVRAHVEITVPVLTLMGDDLRRDTGVADPWSTDPANPDPGNTDPANPGPANAGPVNAEGGPTNAGPANADGSTAEGTAIPLPSPELDGAVPIGVDTARVLAGSATGWDRVLTHPLSGALLAVDRYRPSAQLRRRLRVRDQRCRFPTCGFPARACDLDHTEAAAAGGSTAEDNLGDLCRRHHVLKHCSPWHVSQSPGGVFEWLSPSGRIYIDRPPPQNTATFPGDTATFPGDTATFPDSTAMFPDREPWAGAEPDPGVSAEHAGRASAGHPPDS